MTGSAPWDDLWFYQPFPAQVTAMTTVSGQNRFDWTEMGFDPATGAYAALAAPFTPRRGSAAGGGYAVEVNGAAPAPPFYAWLRFRTGLATDDGACYDFLAPATAAAGGGVTAVGPIDTQTPAANAAVISGTSIYFQSASVSAPGMVNTSAQSVGGTKTFHDGLVVDRGLTTGDVGTMGHDHLQLLGYGSLAGDNAALGIVAPPYGNITSVGLRLTSARPSPSGTANVYLFGPSSSGDVTLPGMALEARTSAGSLMNAAYTIHGTSSPYYFQGKWGTDVVGNVFSGGLCTTIGAAGATDQLVKVSSADTTANYLMSKLVAGSGVIITQNNAGANETLTITASGSTPGGSAGGDLTGAYPSPTLDPVPATARLNVFGAAGTATHLKGLVPDPGTGPRIDGTFNVPRFLRENAAFAPVSGQLLGYNYVDADEGTLTVQPSYAALTTADAVTVTLDAVTDLLVCFFSFSYITPLAGGAGTLSKIYLDGVQQAFGLGQSQPAAGIPISHCIVCKLAAVAAGARTISVRFATNPSGTTAHWSTRSLRVYAM